MNTTVKLTTVKQLQEVYKHQYERIDQVEKDRQVVTRIELDE